MEARQLMIHFGMAAVIGLTAPTTARAQDDYAYQFGIRFRPLNFQSRDFTGFSFTGRSFRLQTFQPIQFEAINFPGLNSVALRRQFTRNDGEEKPEAEFPALRVRRNGDSPAAGALQHSAELLHKRLSLSPVERSRLETLFELPIPPAEIPEFSLAQHRRGGDRGRVTDRLVGEKRGMDEVDVSRRPYAPRRRDRESNQFVDQPDRTRRLTSRSPTHSRPRHRSKSLRRRNAYDTGYGTRHAVTSTDATDRRRGERLRLGDLSARIRR